MVVVPTRARIGNGKACQKNRWTKGADWRRGPMAGQPPNVLLKRILGDGPNKHHGHNQGILMGEL